MTEQVEPRFQILALSGGGFRGLYTAQIIAKAEERLGGRSLATRFDLLAGTSIGGILALALAMEIPAQKIVTLFTEFGEDIFKKRGWAFFGFRKSLHDSSILKGLLSGPDLFGDATLDDCKHPVIVPTINFTTGKPQLFKTPHHDTFKNDGRRKLVDVALATSAAPVYFQRHLFEHTQYVDGGLFANAPGLLALHEAEHFLQVCAERIHLMAIGTMSALSTVNPAHNRDGGIYDWAGGLRAHKAFERLFGLSISVHESLTNNLLTHRLSERYYHIDDDLTADKSKAVALNKADAAAQEALLGSAQARFQTCSGDQRFLGFLSHHAPTPIFHREAPGHA